MNFKEYLEKKKIDPGKFAKAEPGNFKKLKAFFNEVHPESFTMQKKFLINDLRLKYHFEGSPSTTTPPKPAAPSIKKPGVKIKSKSGVKIKPRKTRS